VTTLESRMQFSTFATRIAGTLIGAFGLLALVLATVGIYGVTAYITRQRTQRSAFAWRWARAKTTFCAWFSATGFG
jgi:hypothetical protein